MRYKYDDIENSYTFKNRHNFIDPLQNDSTNLGSEKLPNENISSTKFERQVEALFSVPLLFIDTEMVCGNFHSVKTQ